MSHTIKVHFMTRTFIPVILLSSFLLILSCSKKEVDTSEKQEIVTWREVSVKYGDQEFITIDDGKIFTMNLPVNNNTENTPLKGTYSYDASNLGLEIAYTGHIIGNLSKQWLAFVKVEDNKVIDTIAKLSYSAYYGAPIMILKNEKADPVIEVRYESQTAIPLPHGH